MLPRTVGLLCRQKQYTYRELYLVGVLLPIQADIVKYNMFCLSQVDNVSKMLQA